MNDENLGKNATRILVVDDELAIKGILRTPWGQGYFVQVAGNGKEGMNSALALRPDLIILDLGLPIWTIGILRAYGNGLRRLSLSCPLGSGRRKSPRA